MSMLLAIVLGVHLRNRPPGMTSWRFLLRCFVIKFYWHKTVVVNRNHPSQRYTIRCDDLDWGCLTSCPRQRKLREWEALDTKATQELPTARLI